MKRLTFYAGEGGSVPSASAARGGRIARVGMRLAENKIDWVPTGEAEEVALYGPDASADHAYYAKALRDGQIRPGDRATAEHFGLPWREPESAPALALEAPSPPDPAGGHGRALLAQERPDAQAPAPADDSPLRAALGPAAARTPKGR